MEYIRKNIKPVVLVMLTVIGLIVTVYLVQQRQVLKSRAFSNAGQSIEVNSNEPEKGVNYDESSNSFKTTSRSIKVKLKPETIEELKNP